MAPGEPPTAADGAEKFRCSFCNKSQDDVRKIIAGPSVFICDECVTVCQDIIATDSWWSKLWSPIWGGLKEISEFLQRGGSQQDVPYVQATTWFRRTLFFVLIVLFLQLLVIVLLLTAR